MPKELSIFSNIGRRVNISAANAQYKPMTDQYIHEKCKIRGFLNQFTYIGAIPNNKVKVLITAKM